MEKIDYCRAFKMLTQIKGYSVNYKARIKIDFFIYYNNYNIIIWKK